ncbi:fluoride efflux transporter FluC [Actinomyces israelii]|uniref:fluoride efflux transporter FluC n=1 Tax=Actinomyces israelii TaxID=1659 RepID=UPI00255330D8|nr:CrcB family protein [Actinomyces israelii]WKR20213.1 Putative fluoride ion transporter CrcB [Actinomyces israelii]
MTAAVWAGLAVGGGLGAIARFTVDGRVSAAVARRRAARTGPPRRGARWAAVVPLGTIAVNLTACFLLGLLAGLAEGAPSLPSQLYTVAGTGFLGGYSTFSTASLEGARLLLDGRGGGALAHALALTAGTLAAAAVGLWLGSALRPVLP